MNMTSDFKRRIHIEGQPDNPSGHMLTVRDADTGEMITNVKSGVVYLDAAQINRAELTFYEKDERNQFVVQNDEPVMQTTTLGHEDVSLNVTAMEPVLAPTEPTPNE